MAQIELKRPATFQIQKTTVRTGAQCSRRMTPVFIPDQYVHVAASCFSCEHRLALEPL
jgi:hypothetical protein